MNWFIKKAAILIFLSGQAQATGITLYHTESASEKDIVRRFNVRHGIPMRLLRVHLVESCDGRRRMAQNSRRLVLCANSKELEVINSNSSIIESLSVFKRGFE